LPGANSGGEVHLREDLQGPAYQFTVDDPSTFSKHWSAEMPITAMSNPIYEYACNEGNYAMTGLLGGARSEEKKMAAQKK